MKEEKIHETVEREFGEPLEDYEVIDHKKLKNWRNTRRKSRGSKEKYNVALKVDV